MATLAGRAIVTVLTILYTMLTMMSCSVREQARPVDQTVDNIPQTDAEQEVQLRILNSRGEITLALQRAADVYRQRHPEVRIQVYTVADEHDYRSTLRSRLIEGEAVDLFHIFGYQDMLELENSLSNLGGLTWVRSATGGLLEPVTRDGGIYGVPYAVEGLGLLCNREVFAAAGVSLDGIQSFEDLEDAFADLYAAIIAGELAEDYPNLEVVAAFAGQDRSFLGEQLADIALRGEFVSAQQAQAANTILFAQEEAAGRYVDLMLQYASGGRGWSWLTEVSAARQLEDLAAGRVAVIQGSTQSRANLEMLNSELDLRLIPVPGEEGAGAISIQAPAYWAINAQSDTQSAQAAAAFLEWLYQSEEGATILQEEFGVLSPYYDDAREGEIAAIHRQLLRYMDNDQVVLRRFREFPSGWNAAFAAEVQAYLTELDKSWERVAVDVRESWIDLR